MSTKNDLSKSTVTALAAACMCLLTSAPCLAITAKDVMQKMSKQERFSYLSGLIDMQMFQAGQSGKAAASQCMHDTYYAEAGGAGDGWSKLYDALDQFPDKEATAIVYLLGLKVCGS